MVFGETVLRSIRAPSPRPTATPSCPVTTACTAASSASEVKVASACFAASAGSGRFSGTLGNELVGLVGCPVPNGDVMVAAEQALGNCMAHPSHPENC